MKSIIATHRFKEPRWIGWDYGVMAAGQPYSLFRIVDGEKHIYCHPLKMTPTLIIEEI